MSGEQALFMALVALILVTVVLLGDLRVLEKRIEELEDRRWQVALNKVEGEKGAQK